MKNRDELEALKAGWLKDPCWDIELSEGFEEYQEELLVFRKEHDAAWEAMLEENRATRRRLVTMETSLRAHDHAEHISTFSEIESELKHLDNQIGAGDSATGWAQFVIAREQVRATLLLAAQVQRIGDLLEEKNEEDLASRSQDFMTRLHKTE